MKNGNKKHLGFTLIELLVVVLIIGILAAVALPQYQKAVMKSRFSTLKNITRSIADAQEVYYMSNNSYTTDADKLDIQLPETTSSSIDEQYGIYYFSWGYCVIELLKSTKNSNIYCILSNTKNPTTTSSSNRVIAYWTGLNFSASNADIRACYAYGSNKNSVQDKVCKSETGATSADYSGTTLRQWFY